MNPNEFDELNPDAERLPHSGVGIVSFIIGLLAAGGGFCVMIAAMFLAAKAGQMGGEAPGTIAMDENVPAVVAVWLGTVGAAFLAVIGAVLGFVGVLQSDRSRVFPLLGLVINGAIVLGVGALLLLAAFLSATIQASLAPALFFS